MPATRHMNMNMFGLLSAPVGWCRSVQRHQSPKVRLSFMSATFFWATRTKTNSISVFGANVTSGLDEDWIQDCRCSLCRHRSLSEMLRWRYSVVQLLLTVVVQLLFSCCCGDSRLQTLWPCRSAVVDVVDAGWESTAVSYMWGTSVDHKIRGICRYDMISLHDCR